MKVSCILSSNDCPRADDLGAGGAGRGVKTSRSPSAETPGAEADTDEDKSILGAGGEELVRCSLPTAETPGAEADADEDISILGTGGVDSGVDG